MGPADAFPPGIGENDIDVHFPPEQATLVDQLQPANQPTLGHSAGWETWSCAWSPDGSYFAWSCGNRIVKLVPWNRFKNTTLSQDNTDLDGQPLPPRKTITIDCGTLVWSLAFGSSSAEQHCTSNANWWRYHKASDLVLATGLDNGRIRVWNVVKGNLMLELLDHLKVVRDMAFAPDGSMRLASAARDGTLKMWDLQDDGNMYKTLAGPSKWMYGVSWSPDAKLLASCGDMKSVIIWDMENYKKMHQLRGHYHDVVSCAFSPDGALLATASHDTRVIIWDPVKAEMIKELRHLHPPPSLIFAAGANGAYIRGVAFCQDGTHVATICDDSYLRFWNLSHPYAPEQITTIHHAVSCAYSPNGKTLAVGTRNGTVTFWQCPHRAHDLQHLCRMAFRRICPSPMVEKLHLPVKVKNYLLYKD